MIIFREHTIHLRHRIRHPDHISVASSSPHRVSSNLFFGHVVRDVIVRKYFGFLGDNLAPVEPCVAEVQPDVRIHREWANYRQHCAQM
jgi:hypothetical protein